MNNFGSDLDDKVNEKYNTTGKDDNEKSIYF
jgi:hypothetical protein